MWDVYVWSAFVRVRCAGAVTVGVLSCVLACALACVLCADPHAVHQPLCITGSRTVHSLSPIHACP